MRSARALLENVVDYAGLFPPASLPMSTAVSAYAAYLSGPDRELLGRFVLPSARLAEFSDCAAENLPRGNGSIPWRLSAICGTTSPDDREAVLEFNGSHWQGSDLGRAVVDSIEVRAPGRDAITAALALYPEFFRLFLELSTSVDPVPAIATLSGTRAGAKLRTGGVTPGTVPPTADVLRFLKACAHYDVPFKATAGLHHAIRAEYPLTYETNADVSTMFGYLNLFIASAFIRHGADDEIASAILNEASADAFDFDDNGITWRGQSLTVDQLAETRSRFAMSYGSCSFTEPVEEARLLGLL